MALLSAIYTAFILVQLFAAYSSEVCPQIYLRYSNDHSYCKAAKKTCNPIVKQITQQEIALILKLHNDYRHQVATGQTKLPKAGDMLEMVWDNELAAIAQKRAEQCEFSHDCANCRRVQNFGVGQNIANEFITNSPVIPPSNWPLAVEGWYDEIQYFPPNYISSFVAPTSEPTYGHFTQVAWAKSWRIGCGYVLYKEEPNTHKKLYVCNYGPSGNMVHESMYKIGPPCSACPANTGCSSIYNGLCSVTGNYPVYKPESSYSFYCDFSNYNSDCGYFVNGKGSWLNYSTLTGNYLGIVLNGGETSTVTFKQHIKPGASPFCLRINYRKGPNINGQIDSNSAVEKFTIFPGGSVMSQTLPDFSGNAKQQFSFFDMSLSGITDMQLGLSFTVPPGMPEQFFEISDISAENGPCKSR